MGSPLRGLPRPNASTIAADGHDSEKIDFVDGALPFQPCIFTVRLIDWALRASDQNSPNRRHRRLGMQPRWTMNTDLKSSIANWGTACDVFARLEGDWTLDRHVDGRALMKGFATFRANHDGSLACREHGRVHLADGQAFEAERRYLYRASPTGFSVFFFEEPARLFHDVALEMAHGRLMSEASHRCKDDLYLSRYQFLADGTFLIRHQVSGPRKSYTLETTYDRSRVPT
jgi:hypothetical protein